MKNGLLTLFTMFWALTAFAQKPLSFEISGGFGLQEYKGDLGSRFFRSMDCSYGVASLNFAMNVNSSFDLGLSSSLGDLGLCQTAEVRNAEIPKDDRCVGCGEDRVGLGNLNSRMATAGVFVRYKFANGYLLKSTSRIHPYVYAGASLNRLTDRMRMGCVKEGLYSSINGGVGMQFDVVKSFFIGLNTGIGMFTRDDLDFLTDMHKDLHMQHSFLIGFRL